MITYLVTGAVDVTPAHEVLRRSGRRVRHGEEVRRPAADELRSGNKYVVVAHGDRDGTVYWSFGETSEDSPWMWVGMNPGPGRARVYLYCCDAGPALTRSLKGCCECFGHSSKVPAPVDEAQEVVLRFLDQVDQLMEEADFGVGRWRRSLEEFVGLQLDGELQNPTSLLGPAFWVALAKSLRPHVEIEV